MKTKKTRWMHPRPLRRLGLFYFPRGVWNNTAMYILKFNMLNHLTS